MMAMAVGSGVAGFLDPVIAAAILDAAGFYEEVETMCKENPTKLLRIEE